VRVDTGSKLSYVAVTGKGAGVEDGNEVLCLSLLQRILGVGSRVPFGYGAGTRLGEAAAAAAGEASVHVSAVNMNYLNSGLFGFSLAVDATKAADVLSAVIKEMRKVSSSVNDASLSRAKTSLKVDLLSKVSGGEGCTEFMALQALTSGSVRSADDFSAAIDAITANDVVNAGKRALEGKPSVAVVGNIHAVPYLDKI